MADLLDSLRTHLVAEGIVRVPAAAGPLPPLWLEPRDGTPAPGEGNNLAERHPTTVLGAFRATGIAPSRHEGFIRREAVDFWIRVSQPQLAFGVHDQLRGALNDRRQWDMAGLTISESLMFRDLQRLAADSGGWTFVTEFVFERWDAPEGASVP